jgi:hypothetical protein
LDYGALWWVSPDSNRDAPMEHSALQAGAAKPYPPDTRTFLLTNLAESLGIEPSRA